MRFFSLQNDQWIYLNAAFHCSSAVSVCRRRLTVQVLGELRVFVIQRRVKALARRLSFSKADGQEDVALLGGGRRRLDPLQIELREGAAGEQSQRHGQHGEAQAAAQARELGLKLPLWETAEKK